MVVRPVEDVFRALELEGVVERPLQRNPDVVVHRKMREDSHSLEQSNDPAAGDPRWPPGGDVAAVLDDRPAARFGELGQKIADSSHYARFTLLIGSTSGVAFSSGLEMERPFCVSNEGAATDDLFGAGSRNRTGTPEGTGF